jgi:hypothetical protein
MKLNRGMLVAAAVAAVTVLGVGFVTVVGVDRAADSDDPRVVAETAATEQTGAMDDDTTPTAANSAGVEQYRGGAVHGGTSHAGAAHAGASHAAEGARGGHEGGFGRGGYGRGGYDRGGRWGGDSRWGRWGGGRYVGGRWVDGPYSGWCDARYYDCNRAWY